MYARPRGWFPTFLVVLAALGILGGAVTYGLLAARIQSLKSREERAAPWHLLHFAKEVGRFAFAGELAAQGDEDARTEAMLRFEILASRFAIVDEAYRGQLVAESEEAHRALAEIRRVLDGLDASFASQSAARSDLTERSRGLTRILEARAADLLRISLEAQVAERTQMVLGLDALQLGLVANACLVLLVVLAFLAERSRQARRARASEAALQSILDMMPALVAVVDRDGRIALANRRLAEVLRLQASAQARGLALRDALGGEAGATIQLRLASALSGGDRPVTFEHSGEDQRSERRDWLTLMTPLRLPLQPEHVVAVSIDITDRKRDEARIVAQVKALNAANDALAGTIDQLNAARRQLVEREKLAALGTLVAGIAHEMNTPIGISVSAASSLDEELRRMELELRGDRLTRDELRTFVEEARRHVRLVLSGSERAAALVGSFQQLSDESWRHDRERIALDSFVRGVVGAMAGTWEQRGHRLVIESQAAVEVETYPSQLALVVTQLVENAVAHGYPDGRAGEIRIALSAPENGVIEIWLTDDGRGIPTQDRARIFEPFFTTRRGAGHAGLGLLLVHAIVTQRLGGSIVHADRAAGGTAFVIKLPLVAPEAAAPQRARMAAA
ncbi:MAG: PAS domain-containing sensor histidine kinase [Alphaproteobacteria bacterium]|nr:PAS domain-containing sensor histidine kinase [Alphaproteobacteria bacterium]